MFIHRTGAPWLPIVVWIALRLTYENKGCWDIFDIDSIWWVLRIPVILSITVSMLDCFSYKYCSSIGPCRFKRLFHHKDQTRQFQF